MLRISWLFHALYFQYYLPAGLTCDDWFRLKFNRNFYRIQLISSAYLSVKFLFMFNEWLIFPSRLFTKLFTLLRLKTKCFGADVNVTVSCLKCLIECLDIKAIVKISYAEDFVRVRLMPFFAFCADDLNLLIRNLNSGRYSHTKVRFSHFLKSYCYLSVNSSIF